MRKFLKALVLIPLAVVILAFAVVNRETVTFTLDPLGFTESALTFSLPLFALAFLLLIAGVVVGGVAAWLGQHKWRRAARQFEAEAKALRAERDSLRAQLNAAPPPGDLPRLRPPAA